MKTKICSKCKKEKTVDCFQRNKAVKKDGFCRVCRECTNATRSNYNGLARL